MQPKKLVGVRMADCDHEKLQRLAQQSGQTISSVMRQLIEAAELKRTAAFRLATKKRKPVQDTNGFAE